jgi:hypothetical protein
MKDYFDKSPKFRHPMTRRQALFLLLILAVNATLVTVYFTRRGEAIAVWREVLNEPAADIFQYAYRNVYARFTYSGKESSYHEFGFTSKALSEVLETMLPSIDTSDCQKFYHETNPVPFVDQDSLWSLVIKYSRFSQAVVEVTRPVRLHYLNEANDLEELKENIGKPPSAIPGKIKLRLDSLRSRFGANVIENVDSRIAYALGRSNPAAEVLVDSKLETWNALFPSSGKAVLYGKVYSLDKLTNAQRHQVFRYAIRIKVEVDQAILKYVYG